MYLFVSSILFVLFFTIWNNSTYTSESRGSSMALFIYIFTISFLIFFKSALLYDGAFVFSLLTVAVVLLDVILSIFFWCF